MSVVIITYNQQHCIDRAIAGVMHQRGDFDIELIVANDASTDDTLTHIKHWQQLYPDNIRIIDHKTNVGFRANYLSGFRQATGKYLCVCDADDYWTCRDKIRRQVKWMDSHPECAITFHRVTNVYEPSRIKTLSNGGQKADTTIADLSRRNYITNLSVMYRRGLIATEDLPQWLAEVSLPDYAYHMLYAAHGSIHYLPTAMGAYVQSSAGAWSLSGEMHRLEMALDVRERLIRHFGGGHVAIEGLCDASVDILAAMLMLAEDAGDDAKCTQLRAHLRKYGLDDEMADEAVAHRRALMAKRANTVKKIVKQAYHQLTRLLPNPQPC